MKKRTYTDSYETCVYNKDIEEKVQTLLSLPWSKTIISWRWGCIISVPFGDIEYPTITAAEKSFNNEAIFFCCRDSIIWVYSPVFLPRCYKEAETVAKNLEENSQWLLYFPTPMKYWDLCHTYWNLQCQSNCIYINPRIYEGTDGTMNIFHLRYIVKMIEDNWTLWHFLWILDLTAYYSRIWANRNLNNGYWTTFEVFPEFVMNNDWQKLVSYFTWRSTEDANQSKPFKMFIDVDMFIEKNRIQNKCFVFI